MTQKQKDLLLKDLCSRLPYGVKARCLSHQIPLKILSINPNGVIWVTGDKGYPFEVDCIEYIKPYLFPLSSMTEWQDRELEILMKNSIESCGMLSPYDCLEMERFFNENHLDWRGLIPMGLAIDATGKNIY